MDYRCPVCRVDLPGRRVGGAVVIRMEIDCPKCKSTIRHNFHRTEVLIVLLSFGMFFALAAFAYSLQSQTLTLLAFGAALAGALALPLLEHTFLRNWPRYASANQSPVR